MVIYNLMRPVVYIFFAILAIGLFTPSDKVLAQNTLRSSNQIPSFFNKQVPFTKPSSQVTSIHFATSVAFPPFNFFDAKGRLVGFNVDIAAAICKELDVPCTIEAQDFATLIERLESGKADAVIAGLDADVAQSEALIYSAAYMRFPARFVVRKETQTQTPQNAKVAVVKGSRHEAFLLKYYPQSQIIALPSANEAGRTLRKGDADFLFGDAMQLSFWLQGQASAHCCSFHGGPFLNANYFGKAMTIAVSKTRPDLVENLNFALFQINQKGVFKELYLKYFPLSFF